MSDINLSPVVIAQHFNGYFTPIADVKENNDFIIVEIELPGVNPKDLLIELGDGTLDIRGEIKDDNINDIHYIRKERVRGKFKKSIPVHNFIGAFDIKAQFKEGLLIIEIPKPKDKNNSKKQKINIL